MRIATSFFYKYAAEQLTRHQSEIGKIQEQISTGKKILRPSDDPAGASRALDITQTMNTLQQYNDNAIFAETRLSLEDTILDNVTNLIHRIKELALQADNATSSLETRNALLVEVQERLGELIDLANSKDANGDYLYSGFQASSKPFVRSGTTVSYNGDQGQRFIQLSASRQMASSNSGFEVFQHIRNGNGSFNVTVNTANTGNGIIAAGSVVNATSFQPQNFTIRFTSNTTFDVINDTTATTILTAQPYTDGSTITFNGIETYINGTPLSGDEFFVRASQNQDLFTTVQNLATALSTSQTNSAVEAQVSQSINNVISDLDESLGHILNVRTSIGARLKSIDSTLLENESVKFELQSALSYIEDADYAEAISRLEFQLQTLQATQLSFANIEGLSLFNYIR